MKKVRFARELILSLILLALLAACSPTTAPEINIEGAWGRPSMSMPTAGSMYMVIKNSGDAPDTLLSGSSPACGSIEVHEMVMKSDGTMGMNLIDQPLEITPGSEVTLEPGGLHIMCIMKKDSFAVGNTVDLTLEFENSGEQTFSVELRSE